MARDCSKPISCLLCQEPDHSSCKCLHCEDPWHPLALEWRISDRWALLCNPFRANKLLITPTRGTVFSPMADHLMSLLPPRGALVSLLLPPINMFAPTSRQPASRASPHRPSSDYSHYPSPCYTPTRGAHLQPHGFSYVRFSCARGCSHDYSHESSWDRLQCRQDKSSGYQNYPPHHQDCSRMPTSPQLQCQSIFVTLSFFSCFLKRKTLLKIYTKLLNSHRILK